MRLAFLTTLAVFSALPASAQVRVAIGEEVVFALGGAAEQSVRRTPAEANAFETFIGAKFAGGQFKEATGASGVGMRDQPEKPPAPRAEAAKIRVRFTPTPQGHSLLVIENGYDQGLIYRATITARGRTAPTDVCLVMPGKAGVEHWPFEIASIELTDFRLVAWKPGDRAPCA